MTPLHLVVLAAGRGSRLHAVGDDRPKWLVEVAGTTIADRQLAAIDALPEGVVRRTTVVTGHAADTIRALDLPVDLLHNPQYLELNNWWTVLLAIRDAPADARVVVVNGDLCARPAWLTEVLLGCATTAEDGLLAIDFDRTLTAESMKVSARDGALDLIGKHEFASPVGEYVGVLMASGSALASLRQELEGFVGSAADAQQWYEGAVGRSAAAGQRWWLMPTPDSSWVEVDDLADLALASELVDA